MLQQSQKKARWQLLESPVTSDQLPDLARRLATAKRVTVLTGAGISVASGIPTFRGPHGLWRQHKPEELATPHAFAQNPLRVWEWYSWRRELIKTCQPNRGHDVLACWSKRFQEFLLITQNVDGLHERAGTKQVLNFHGSIWHLKCSQSCAKAPSQWKDESVPLSKIPPRCPHCGNLARPAVVWFGETIDVSVLNRSLVSTHCDIFIAIGTSALVNPASSLIAKARTHGAYTVELNLEATPASPEVDLSIYGPADELLDRLHQLLTKCQQPDSPPS